MARRGVSLSGNIGEPARDDVLETGDEGNGDFTAMFERLITAGDCGAGVCEAVNGDWRSEDRVLDSVFFEVAVFRVVVLGVTVCFRFTEAARGETLLTSAWGSSGVAGVFVGTEFGVSIADVFEAADTRGEAFLDPGVVGMIGFFLAELPTSGVPAVDFGVEFSLSSVSFGVRASFVAGRLVDFGGGCSADSVDGVCSSFLLFLSDCTAEAGVFG